MRINIVPVQLLADQHLLAEYREIKMLPKCLVRSILSKCGVNYNTLPKKFTLNTGHGKFFYDKLKFIENRFQELLIEMKNRNFQVNMCNLYDDNYDYSTLKAINYSSEYVPSKEDMNINIERLLIRISEKENWYKYYGKKLSYSEFENLYKGL